jgi:hypothetical protein
LGRRQGTSGLLATQIWAEDTNKRDGLLVRPVKLDYYDDQTEPSVVHGIYTKPLDRQRSPCALFETAAARLSQNEEFW